MRTRTLPGRLDPIEIDRAAARSSAATICASRKAISRTSFTSGPLTRYCTGHPTGGPSSSGTMRRHRAGKFVLQHALELGAQPLAGGDVLGDHHELAEEIVGQLDAEREIEPDRAASDIGAPALDIGIVLEHRIELGRRDRCWRRSTRSAAACRSTSSSGRSDDGKNCRGTWGRRGARRQSKRASTRIVIHRIRMAATSTPRKMRTAMPGSAAARVFGLRQQCHAQQRNEEHRDQPRGEHRDADDREDRERVLAGRARWRTRSARSRRWSRTIPVSMGNASVL